MRRAWRIRQRQIILHFCPTGKSLVPPNCGVSSPLRKNILIFRSRKSVYMFAIPSHSEGRCANVNSAGRVAVAVEGALDENAQGGRQKRVVPMHPMLASSRWSDRPATVEKATAEASTP